jgi:SAM-dependent methyltransferase
MGKLFIPEGAKRILVPIWNEAHRLGWLVRDYGSACLHGRWERCAVCGRVRPMLFRRRVIPRRLEQLWGLTPPLAMALARKESSNCSSCGAKLRARRMAAVILQTYPIGIPPAPACSLAAWTQSDAAQRLRIAEVNLIEGLHEQLLNLPNFKPSDYQPGARPGATANGVRSEDLTRLTYADSRFDLLLTSETLEHVSDLAAALREVHRVLAAGGRHIFTIPLLPGVGKTFARIQLRPDGSLDHVAPLICHPGGDTGYPVFTEFGTDVCAILRQAGFDVTVHFGPTSEDDLAQVYVCTRVIVEQCPTS